MVVWDPGEQAVGPVSESAFTWFSLSNHEDLKKLQNPETVDLPTEVRKSIHRCQAGNDPEFLCVRGTNVRAALDAGKILILPGDLGVLVKLLADKMEGWEGALTRQAPEEIQTVLLNLVLRQYAEGALKKVLEELENSKDWANIRIVDVAAWNEKKQSHESKLPINCLTSQGDLFCVIETEAELRPGLLAFRCTRLSLPSASPLLLTYTTKHYDYKSQEFLDWAERLLSNARLLLLDNIVQRLCTFHKPLFGKILDYLEDTEITITVDLAHRHVVESLRNYTYDVAQSYFDKVHCPKYLSTLSEARNLEPPSLSKLMDLDKEEQSRIEALVRINGPSFTRARDDFHAFFQSLIQRRNLRSVTTGKMFLATFDFSVHQEVACAELQEIPPAMGVTYPTMKARDLVPILLRRSVTNTDEDFTDEKEACRLHWSFRRNVIVDADVELYDIPLSNGMIKRQFGLATWNHNLDEKEARAAMEIMAHRRLPLHERRLLQLLKIPCRESLEDMESQNLSKVIEESSQPDRFLAAECYDNALLHSVDEILNLRERLSQARSQEDVWEVLEAINSNENHNFSSNCALGTIEVLEKLVKFQHLEHPKLAEWLKNRQAAFKHSNDPLLELIVEWVLILMEQGCSALKADGDLATAFRTMVWLELQAVFPDDNSWTQLETSVDMQQRPGSIFSATVLHALFQRPFLQLYEKPYMLPKRELKISLGSIERLHRLTSVLPVCCGDWSTGDYFKDHSHMRKVAESRIFASVRPAQGRPKSHSNTIVPDPTLFSRDSYCFKSGCMHAPFNLMPAGSLLFKIAESADQLEAMSDTLTRCGFWLNTIIDNKAHYHFRCEHCDGLMVPDRNTSKPYYFSCPRGNSDEQYLEHDNRIYLNWCLGKGCQAIVDSRASEQCSKGSYICSKCQSCCKNHKEVATNDGPPACHKCRRKLQANMPAGIKVGEFLSVSCSCGAENHIFHEKTNSDQLDGLAALWPSSFRIGFDYNIRP